jgi:hypothetical protein
MWVIIISCPKNDFCFVLTLFYFVFDPKPLALFEIVWNLKRFKSMQILLQNKAFCFKNRKGIIVWKKKKKGWGRRFGPGAEASPGPASPRARNGMPRRRRAADRWAPPVRHLVILNKSSPDMPVTAAIRSASISQILAPSASQNPPMNTPAPPLSPRTNNVDREAPKLPQSSPHHHRCRHPPATPRQAPATNWSTPPPPSSSACPAILVVTSASPQEHCITTDVQTWARSHRNPSTCWWAPCTSLFPIRSRSNGQDRTRGWIGTGRSEPLRSV